MLRGDTTLLTGGTSHPFRFTGKELDRLNSLNIYDFSARWYDYADKYDFDMKSWKNPLNWGRNSETIIGEHVAGEGKPFEINIYGSKKLKSMYP